MILSKKNLTVEQLQQEAQRLIGHGGRMVMAYAWLPPKQKTFQVIYLGQTKGNLLEQWRVELKQGEALPSLAQIAPLLSWYEREIMDLFALKIEGHPEPYPLILHEGAEWKQPPLIHRGEDELMTFHSKPWHSAKMDHSQLQDLLWGPIRSDVAESAAFDYRYAGELIIYYDQKLFYKHRGMEKRFCHLEPDQGVVLAERTSGIGSFSHALAYCQAIEAAAGTAPPPRASYGRVILSELERLYNHLHFLGHLCHTTTLKVGASEGLLLEEWFKQLNGEVTGSRFLRGMATPGGLRRELNLEPIRRKLPNLKTNTLRYIKRLRESKTHIDRLVDNGVVLEETARDQGATGPVGRASNLPTDWRVHFPYAVYDTFSWAVACRQEGDANARAEVRMDEIATSFSIIEQALEKMPSGEIHIPTSPMGGSEGLGWVESPRGATLYSVHLNEVGRLDRVKIKSASFSNWRVFPFTVHGSGLMDFAINEASFGLSIAGCDR